MFYSKVNRKPWERSQLLAVVNVIRGGGEDTTTVDPNEFLCFSHLRDAMAIRTNVHHRCDNIFVHFRILPRFLALFIYRRIAFVCFFNFDFRLAPNVNSLTIRIFVSVPLPQVTTAKPFSRTKITLNLDVLLGKTFGWNGNDCCAFPFV